MTTGRGRVNVARGTVIPDAIIPSDRSGQQGSGAANSSAKKSKQPLMVVGKDSTIPVLYGGPERLPGKWYYVGLHPTTNEWVMVLILCEGPIEAITGADLNDQPLTTATQVGNLVTFTNGCTMRMYLGGSDNIIDPTLALCIPGYADTMPGTAYVVITVPQGVSPGIPRFHLYVKGLKVRDPRLNGFFAQTLGQKVSTPDTAANSITGNLQFDIQFTPTRSLPVGVAATLAWKWDGVNQCAWALNWNTTGVMTLFTSPTGAVGAATGAVSSAVLPVEAGQPIWVRVQRTSANGAVNFYYGYDGSTWTQLGTTVTNTAGAIFNSTQPVEVGSVNSSGADWTVMAGGWVHRFRLFDNIDGTLVNNFDPANSAEAAVSVVASTGETWSIAGANAISINRSVWSRNTALHLADFLSNTSYGEGKVVNWAYAKRAADVCDAMLTGAGGSERRVETTLLLDGKQDTRQWVNTLRSYIPAWVDYEGDIALIVADDLRATVDHVFDASKIDTETLPLMVKRGPRDIPTVVEVGYTKTDELPWKIEYVSDGSNPAVRRKTRIEMPGIRRGTQAKRAAAERRNHYIVEDMEGQIAVFEEGLKVFLGDRIQVIDDVFGMPGLELLSNTDFTVGTGWVLSNGTVTISGGKLNFAASVAQTASLPTTMAVGKAYLVKVVVDSITPGGTLVVRVGDAANVTGTIKTPGTHQFHVRTPTSVGASNFVVLGSGTAVIDSVSLKEMPIIEAKVTGKDDRGHGRWLLAFRKYDPNAYVVTVDPPVASPTPNLPDPRTVAAPTGLSASEKYFQESNQSDDSLGRGYIWQSRIEASWTASAHAYPVKYLVKLIDRQVTPNVVVDEKVVSAGTSYASPAIQQGTESAAKLYDLEVRAENSLGFTSSIASVLNIPVNGRQLPPGNVPEGIIGFEIGGEVLLSWPAAATIDTIRYEWRYRATPFASQSDWDGATFIDRIDGLRASFKGLPVGAWYFGVKAINSAGKYSADATDVTITVTSDADAFVQSKSFVPFEGAELVTNGGFSADASWVKGAGCTISGGTLNFNTAGGVVNGQGLTGINNSGKWFKLVFTVTSITVGGVWISFNSSSTPVITNPGTYTVYLQAPTAVDDTVYIGCNVATIASVDNVSVKEVGMRNMIPFPPLEGVNKQRWVTSVLQAGATTFNTITGGTLNSATAQPIVQFHPSSTLSQLWTGETWDLTVSVTGDWFLTADITVINGSVTYGIETKNNIGDAWVLQTGTSWKGQARYVRPVITATGTSTIRINEPPVIRLAAVTKNEQGTVRTETTPGSAVASSVRVDLANAYSAYQDLQLTVVNTSLGRLAAADRILLYPEEGLMFKGTISGGADNFVRQRIKNTVGYVIVAGDYFEYEVWSDSSNPGADAATIVPGGCFISFTDASNMSGSGDQQTGATAIGAGLGTSATGKWHYRSFLLAGSVGKTVADCVINNDCNTNGDFKTIYRNINIRGTGGVLRHAIYATSGEPSDNVAWGGSVGATNVQCGPTNSFLVYCRDTGGTLQVNDVQYSFKGF